MDLVLSNLPKIWLIDIDGVILRHNGYQRGEDSLLPGARQFWSQISDQDKVILLTARHEDLRERTLAILASHGLRYDIAVFGLPSGERICINDCKPSGLLTSHALNLTRDEGLSEVRITIDRDR